MQKNQKKSGLASWLWAFLGVFLGFGGVFGTTIYDAGAQYVNLVNLGGTSKKFVPNQALESQIVIENDIIEEKEEIQEIQTVAGNFPSDNKPPKVVFAAPEAIGTLSRLKSNVLLVETLPLTGNVAVPAWLRDKYNANTIFADVSADNAYYEATVDLFRMGVVAGQANTGKMQLEKSINRAELSKVLAFANEITLMKMPERPFTDIKGEEWFAKYTESLKHAGIFDGYPDGEFKPANKVNFGQMLKLATLTSGLNVRQGGEIWQKPYYDAALEANLIPEGLKGADYGKEMTRGEVFGMIQRSLSRKDSGALAYRESISLTSTELNLQNAKATYTLPTDASVWLTDLTQTGMGYYFDTTYDNHIIFGHSSLWPGDPSPAGPVLLPILQNGVMEAGDRFTLNVDGQNETYEVLSKGKIEYTSGQVLLDDDPRVDAIIFTCNTDLTERILVRAGRVE